MPNAGHVVNFEAPYMVAAVPGATSLDTRGQTPSHQPSVTGEYAALYAEWRDNPIRMAVIGAFLESGDYVLQQRGHRMADCSSKVFILATATGARVTVNHCDDRACAPCSGHRTKGVRKQFEKISATAGRIRFLTITQRSRVGESLRDARARLRGSERKLRQRKAWKDHVDGALRSEETTWSEGAWHVHFHYMYAGGFWWQHELTDEWAQCGDGCIVDIRKAYNVNELLKYSLKTAGVPDDRLVEWAVEMTGVREVEFLGSWRGKLPDDDAQEPATADELAAFRYVCEESTLEAGDHRVVTEDRLKYVAFSDHTAPPHAASWALDRLRECFASLLTLRERVGPRLDKRETYSNGA